MPKFAANLTMMFNEVDFMERFGRAAAAGFKGVEFLFPYAYPKEALAEQLQRHGLAQVLHNLPAGDWAKGDRGIACNPARQEEFRAGVAKGIAYARTLGVPQLNCLAGLPGAGTDDATARRTLVENLRFAAKALKEAGIKLLVEPINNYDVPGFWLNSTPKAISVLDEVGADNAYVQYDIYHAQRYEGELAGTIARYLPRIAHIQIADNPGRNEPGTGEIHYPFLFAHLQKIGYDGFIGAEYKPAGATEAGLGWLEQARRQLGANT
jgi:hydroxypyruvate isomerase